jgi:ribosomal protein S18 acetylase RimI-like enzyme
VLIRPFKGTDQEAVKRLVTAGLAEHFGQADESRNPDLFDIQRTYVDQDADFLVVEIDGRIVGTGALVLASPDVGQLVRMSVDASVRRQGIGRMLACRLFELARARGYRAVLVETNLDWAPAIRLYEQCGFVAYARDFESVYLRLTL